MIKILLSYFFPKQWILRDSNNHNPYLDDHIWCNCPYCGMVTHFNVTRYGWNKCYCSYCGCKVKRPKNEKM